MPRRSRSSGLLLIAAAAMLGYGLIWLPPAVSQSFDAIHRVNPTLATAYLAAVGAVAVGLAIFIVFKTLQMWRRSRAKVRPLKRPSKMSGNEMRKEIAKRQGEAEQLLSSVSDGDRRELAGRLEQERVKLETERLEIVAFGTISSGKSSVLNALVGQPVFVTDPRGGTTTGRNEFDWPGRGKVRVVDTPGLGEMHGRDRAAVATRAAQTADLLVYVTDGVLRSFEFEVLGALAELDKRMIVCLNKEDAYSDRDRELLLTQMREQLRNVVPARDFVSVRANPATRVRIRVTPDGEEHEERVTVDADVSALVTRMMEILQNEGQRLLLANLLVRSRALVAETKSTVQERLDAEARDIINTYMWQAGGAAAISPFPLLDIAAGMTISYKMVLDIAGVYRQQLDLDAAREMVAQAGKNLLASAGAAAATPTIASLAASSLKTIPGVGTIAGGLLQGLVQSLVTRWIGLVFLQYFRGEMTDAARALPVLAKTQWEEVTRPSELARLVQEGMRRFGRRRREDGD